ncbi:MAG: amino acid adenylation domain-containing protein, partial [bacterium]|nr:amino acid adenylation domain-containing protein [bacterium]
YAGRELPQLTLQYKDFAQWQNRLFAVGSIKAQEEYWFDIYSGEIPRLELPADFKRPGVFTFEGGNHRFGLEGETAAKFKALQLENGATLYMNILAALGALFYKYTGQTDIIIGSGIAGRNHSNLQGIIGMFVNTLAMRNYPRGDKTYTSFLKEVTAHSVQAYENQDVQFEELVERLQPVRDPSRNPLFDVSMVVRNFRRGGEGLERLTADEPHPGTEYKNTTAKFDLTFFIHEEGENIDIDIEYYTGIFREETVRRMAGHFKNIVNAVIRDPFTRLKDIAIISEEEKRRVLYEFNDTAADYPKDKTIHQLFEEQAARTPDYVAIVGFRSYQTYSQLDRKSNQSARYLHDQKGVRPGDRVGIMLSPVLERPAAVLGILKAGAAYVPIDPLLPEERIKYMINDAAAGVVISEKRYMKTLNRLQCECGSFHSYLCINSEDDVRAVSRCGTAPLNLDISSSGLAYIIYTSGTTGKPKGVMLEHHGVSNLNTVFAGDFQIEPADRIIQFADISFDASVWEMFMALLNGASLHLLSPAVISDYRLFPEYINRYHITVVTLPPPYARHLDPGQLGALRMMVTAGSPASADFIEECRGHFEYINAYGPTESTVCCSYWRLETGMDLSTIPIGKPIANTGLYILDEGLQPQPVGVPGELWLSGAGIARGYLNRPELTTEKFPPAGGPSKSTPLYRTGDLARWLFNGEIEFLGRIDSQVKIRGFRIELEEIEERLSAHPGIREAVVTAREGETGEKYLIAYIVGVFNEAP